MDRFEKGRELTDRILTKCMDKMPRYLATGMGTEIKALISAVAEVMAEEIEKIERKNAELRKKLK